MLNLERIFRDDRLLRAMTGLNRKAFENLLPSFNEAYQQSRSNPEVVRKRAPGGGRKATLRTSRDKLFYILLYCKCYPTFDLMSVLFDFDRSCAWDWVHGLLPVLEQALGHKQVLPERKVRSMEEFLERFPEVKEVIFDGTERPVQRPKDPDKQKEHYSGKKKRHTRKHITGSTRKKRVILLTKARAGKIHDKRQLDEEDLVGNIPDEVVIEGDLGFQGLQNEFDNVHLPHKKPRGKELSEQQKQENREFSRQRVACEHAHAGIKRYRSVTDVYRNRVPDFDDRLMLNAAGLWNLYLDAA
ncbi:transposase [Kovacikia minuta CCNUW1]|uniref:transposase n=1 Tax=Kovacikia minuta TaxID=2931930 RepID=UPI001CCD0C93|nr:transposase [Kovacikia minuta]UBF24001.1 transposase [Kovacikia minuta CCNUW1]